MPASLLLALYCLLIVAGSLGGGWLPSLVRLTHTRMQLMVSFVGGLMLGVSLLHLLPHSAHLTGSLDRTVWWTVVGLLVTFFLIRLFHFHEHGMAESRDGHEEHPAHRPSSADHPQRQPAHDHRLSWFGVFVGLSIHTLIDGVALAAAVMADHAHGAEKLAGLSVFLVVFMHKPLDALSITSLLVTSGWSVQIRQAVNAGFAVMCPLGATLFVVGFGLGNEQVVGCALGFSAGTFLCISLGDLLPEVQFHRHDRFKLSAAFLAGISVAYALGLFESPTHMGHG